MKPWTENIPYKVDGSKTTRWRLIINTHIWQPLITAHKINAHEQYLQAQQWSRVREEIDPEHKSVDCFISGEANAGLNLSFIRLQQLWIPHANLSRFRKKESDKLPLCHRKKEKYIPFPSWCLLCVFPTSPTYLNTAGFNIGKSKGPKVKWRRCCSMPGAWPHAWITACYDNGIKASSR